MAKAISRPTILMILLTLMVARPSLADDEPSSWRRTCAVWVAATVTLVGGVWVANHQLRRTVVNGVISRASSDTQILSVETQAEVLAELILVAQSQSGTYLAEPNTFIDDAEEYLVRKKWMPPRYRQGKSVAIQIFDYVDQTKYDPKVKQLIQELRSLPYGKVQDEDWYEIGIRYLGAPIPDYDDKQLTSGLAWDENYNLRVLWQRSRTGFTDDERQALVPYILLEQHKYSGNRDLLNLLRSAPGFLEAVQEQPENYADWISKAARHLNTGDQDAAKVVGRAMRRMKTGSVIDVLKALGPDCFRTFLIESRHTSYVGEQLVSKDLDTYRPILKAMLSSRNPKEVEIAREIWEDVPELKSEMP